MFKARTALLVFLISLISHSAFAPTTTANLPINATVTPACKIGNITSVNFGNYTGVVNDATGGFEVNCTNSTAYTIALGSGSGSRATVASRNMARTPTPGILAYDLYTTNARTVIWGDGTLSTVTMDGVGTGVVQAYVVYGRIGAALTPTTGAYNDTVLITVTY